MWPILDSRGTGGVLTFLEDIQEKPKDEATRLRKIERGYVIHPGQLEDGNLPLFIWQATEREMTECEGKEQQMEGSRHQMR